MILEVNLINEQDKYESRLVEDAACGDLKSFGELCQKYYSAMAAVAYSILADHQLAEDAAQESFARALVGLSSLKNKKRFAPWLAAICKNVARDMLAEKARRINSSDFTQVGKAEDPDGDDRLIHQAIEQLPEPAKELVVLRYYDGLYYEQISSVLGISKASINGRLTRAKMKMKKYLQRNGFPENQL